MASEHAAHRFVIRVNNAIEQLEMAKEDAQEDFLVAIAHAEIAARKLRELIEQAKAEA